MDCFFCVGVLLLVSFIVIVVFGSRLIFFLFGIIGFLLYKWELRYCWIIYFFFFLRVFWIVVVWVIENYGIVFVFSFLYCFIFLLSICILWMLLFEIVEVVLYFLCNWLFFIFEMFIFFIFLRNSRILCILFLRIVSNWFIFELVRVFEESFDFFVCNFVCIGRWNMVEFFRLKNFFK